MIDPGHQLGNHNFPRADQPAGAGGRVHQAVQHDRDGDQRRLPGGDVRLAGGAAAEAPKLKRLGARVVLTRKSNQQDRWGPCVDRRGRAGNRIDADLKISVHGGRLATPRAPAAST